MNATQAILSAAEGGIIGDGRTGANLALGVALLGLVVGRLAVARATGRVGFGDARVGGLSAVGTGALGVALAVLHLATSSGGPGTGNGMVGAVAAIPLGLAAVVVGRRALPRVGGAGPEGRRRGPGSR
ncbi:DUF6223 family protein [Streptomyces sp. NPDC050400]|uniref:DUF6223 family protein n=1 Tax=Streptomyces sp. NPDC050400 TaxID=3365610 RepID=UPI0037B50339